MESCQYVLGNKKAGLMNKLKLRDLISLNTFTVLSAVVLCLVLVTDPSLLG